MVTHDVEEAVFLGGRVIVLSTDPGRVVAETAVELPDDRDLTVKRAPEFLALRASIEDLVRVHHGGTSPRINTHDLPAGQVTTPGEPDMRRPTAWPRRNRVVVSALIIVFLVLLPIGFVVQRLWASIEDGAQFNAAETRRSCVGAPAHRASRRAG